MGVDGQGHAPAALPPGKRSDTHCTIGWVGLKAGQNRGGKSRLRHDSIPEPSRPKRVAIPTTLSRKMRLELLQTDQRLTCFY